MPASELTHKALTGKIRQALSAIEAGKYAFVKPETIATDMSNLDCELQEVPAILVQLLKEVTPYHYAGIQPPQRSYEERLNNCELYPFKIESKRLGCVIYFKFALKGDSFWLVSFHEDRPDREEH